MNILKNNYKSQLFLQFAADTFAIWLGFALQLYIRFFSGYIEATAHPTLQDYVLGSLMMSIFWYVVFFIAGMYQNWHLRSPFDEFFAVIKTSFSGCFIIVLFLLSDDKTNSFRLLFLLYFVIMTSCFVIFRFIARRIQIYLRKTKIIKIPAIIVGDLDSVVKFYSKSQENISWGFEIKGFIFTEAGKEEIDKKLSEQNMDILLNLGHVDEFLFIIKNNPVEEIIFAAKKPDPEMLIDLATLCENKGIRVKIEPNLYAHFTGQSRTQNIYGIPLIEINTCLQKPWESFMKRAFDIFFSFFVLLLGLPFWIIIAIIIKLDSDGNVFYTQPRVGKNNKLFMIYKFRSMVQDKRKDAQTAAWTKVGDPRVSKFGKFIRKTHLDEIPQFVNVLIGDMSVVGPRPEQPKFAEEFAAQLPYYNRRHLVRPGITGWWQVKYKPHVLDLDEIKNRIKDDFYYIENISIRFDFEILIRTVWCVLRGHGQA